MTPLPSRSYVSFPWTLPIKTLISASSSAVNGPDDASPRLQVALGATVLERAMNSNGHLDGIGTYTAELLKHLGDARIDPHPIACEGFRGTRVSSGVETMPGSFSVNLLRSAMTGVAFTGSRSLASRFDVFHATDHHVPKLRNIPVVATVMDPIPLMHPEWTDVNHRALKNWLFRRSVQWADHYITISKFVIDDIAHHFRIPAERITPIELGVNDDFFVMLSEEEKRVSLRELGLTPPFFLFIGTLQPRKNILRLVEAFKSLPPDIRRACPLIVAGREGWSSEAERAALATLHEEGTGRWLNYVTPQQKKALLQSARALVFPSLYEGFGLPVLEAFASGLPVITSNTTSLPEVAGDAALMVSPLDAGEIAAAMQRVLEDDELWRTLQTKGVARARTFSWERTATRTAELYRRVLS